jgi:hypothetical protein
VNTEDSNPASSPSEAQERKVVLSLCLLAAIHIFIFSAAFPFFNVTDEDMHFDLVVKYSHGHFPVGLEAVSLESAQYLALYSTLEYLNPPSLFPGGKFPPPEWTQPASENSRKLFGYKVGVRIGTNHENSQAPLYYLLAGLWFNAGKVCGLHGGSLLLWLRLLDMLLVAALVWLAHLAARIIFPENYFLRLGVPALAAFIPQTAFYSINNDVLSPLCSGAAFIFLVRLLRTDAPDVRLGIAAGLTLAATYLTKLSNLPLIAVVAAVMVFRVWHLVKNEKFRSCLPSLACLALCAGLPVSIWRAWVKYNFGDSTGTAMKMRILGWTYKPFGEWWHHPLFTPHGFWTFISKLAATFWQGEFLWHGRPLASPVIDIIYLVLSGGFVGIALFALLCRPVVMPESQRQALWFSFACVIAPLGFLAGLSIIYDFHDCFYPSREHPFFTSGRLMLGALIPFLILFALGINCALNQFRDAVKFSVLAAVILFMLISEITIDRQIFPSPYNWFHM